jgi:hypothetical protein
VLVDRRITPYGSSRRRLRRTTEVRFSSIRHDWYKANQLVPRLARKALTDDASSLVFVGFPRQWIPVFEYYRLTWFESSDPIEYIPLLSRQSQAEILDECSVARTHGVLRTLVESIVALDPVLADFLYILDNSASLRSRPEVSRSLPSALHPIRLTSWQSYGRREVRELEADIDRITVNTELAIILPCSRHRPYRTSRTHRRIWSNLVDNGYSASKAHQAVFTSLGIIPEELWEHVVVRSYDVGVPDVYRLLRLARRYFSRNRYNIVLDCLEFRPYSDVLSILSREGIIKKLVRGPVLYSRQFFVKS